MSIDRDDNLQGIRAGASQLLARAAAGESRAEVRLRAAVAQLSQPDDLWIDDRTRAQVANCLSGMIAAIEAELRGHAARALGVRGAADLAEAIARPQPTTEAALAAAGLLAAPDLVRELVARTAQDMTSEALPPMAPSEDDRASLIVRLAGVPDGVVAATAIAYMAAEARRRAATDAGEVKASSQTDLPAELHHRLVWWVTAAIAAELPPVAGPAQAAIDRALTDAALRSLAAHDEGDRLEAAAMQLAGAIDATATELPELIEESLHDRRLPLFIAVLAHALGVDYDLVRDVVLDPVGDRLWIAARALDLPRATMARIGLALCEADPRRDLDGFADQIDMIAAIDADEARRAIAPLTRHPDFRAAAQAIARGRTA